MSGTGIKSRFAELRFPKGAPPLWTWSIIGGAYYVLFFLLLRSILARPPISFWTSVTLTLTAALLIANASWNWVFFRKKDLRWSFMLFVPYLLLAFDPRGSTASYSQPTLRLVCPLPRVSRICNLVGLPRLASQPGGNRETLNRSAKKLAERRFHYQPITAILYITRMGMVANAIHAESV